MFSFLKRKKSKQDSPELRDQELRKWCIEQVTSGMFSYDPSLLEEAKKLYKFLTSRAPMEE